MKYYFRQEAVSKDNPVDQLPLHWPKEVSLAGGRIDLEQETKRNIGIMFKASLIEEIQVIDVDEICNAEFYQKYERFLFSFFFSLQ